MHENLIRSLVKKKFDRAMFKNENRCAICLMEYKHNCEVSPLPCDIRHYFHTECIEEWFKEHE